MTKNPFLNAFAAVLYIILIVLIMDLGTKNMHGTSTFIAPLAVISLFTLSAAVMGYIFCYKPFQLYFDGKKQAAVNLFLQTTAIFGIITVGTVILLFSGLFK